MAFRIQYPMDVFNRLITDRDCLQNKYIILIDWIVEKLA